MLKALGKTKLPKDHPYTSAVAKNGDFVVHKSGNVVGRIPAGEHSIKEETESDTKDNSKKYKKVFANKTQATNFAAKNGGTVKHSPLSGKYYVEVSESWVYQNEATDSAAKDATVKSTKSNVSSNTATTTPYDVKPQRIKSAEFNKLFN